MTFHEQRFPTKLSLGSIGGPERRTEIVTLASGFEQRNAPWRHSRRRYDAGVAMRSLDDMQKVIAFFEARGGRLHAFRWKDWADYKSSQPSKPITPQDQLLMIGDGVSTAIQLCKTYQSGNDNYRRIIHKPVKNTIVVALDGRQIFESQEFSIDLTTGILNFYQPPTEGVAITSGFAFDVPVRFDTDRLEMKIASFQAGEIVSLPIVEVRL